MPVLKSKIRITALWLTLCLIQPALASDLPDFTLSDLHGKSHSLSDYRGKWVLVNYWATWCPPCLEELPELEIFHSKSEGKAVVLGVNMEDISKADLQAFVEDQFLSFPILPAGAVIPDEQRLGNIPGLPTSYLVSPAGKVVAYQPGPITMQAIRRFIQRYEKNEG